MRFSFQVLSCTALLAGAIPVVSFAQGGGNLGDIQQKLHQMFTLAKATADHTDLVSAGSVLVLHRDNFLMYAASQPVAAINVYKDGVLKPSAGRELLGRFLNPNSDNLTDQIPHRSFVAGEKFFVTEINTQPDGVYLTFFSDPYDDVRYYGKLKIPFAKKSAPLADDVVREVEEVVTVDGAPADASAASAPASTGSSSVAPLPVPPPPPAEPKTVALGQTEDQVVAALGQPQTIIDKKAAGKIFVYKDMKVVFKLRKVVDIQ